MAKNTKMKLTARILRQKQTPTEKILWALLRDNQLGVKFRRQMPFVLGKYNYVTDFYSPKIKLIIEVDGSIHNRADIQEYDIFREEIFLEAGYNILRFTNNEVQLNTKEVLDKIRHKIHTLLK